MKENTKGRFLLTWNTDKHPEIDNFFDNVEEGFKAHSVREAIKFYMEHQEVETNTPESSNRVVQESDKNDSIQQGLKEENPRKSVENDNYKPFSPNEVL